jgi:hypothetical protein
MKIIYDNLVEFSKFRIRCEQTRKEVMCSYCPFYDECQVDDETNLHIMHCEVLNNINNSVTDAQESNEENYNIEDDDWLGECKT